MKEQIWCWLLIAILSGGIGTLACAHQAEEPEEAVELAGKMIAVKLDGDAERALVDKFNGRGFLTVVFIDSDENVVKTIAGYRPADKFATELEDTLKKALAPVTEEGGEATKG